MGEHLVRFKPRKSSPWLQWGFKLSSTKWFHGQGPACLASCKVRVQHSDVQRMDTLSSPRMEASGADVEQREPGLRKRREGAFPSWGAPRSSSALGEGEP